MSLFAFTSLFGLGLGSVIGGVIQSTLGWRWIQWIHIMWGNTYFSFHQHNNALFYRFSCVFIVLVSLMGETRSSIILINIARAQRKLSGSNNYKAKAEIDKESLWSLIKTSCTRPLCGLSMLRPAHSADLYWRD